MMVIADVHGVPRSIRHPDTSLSITGMSKKPVYLCRVNP